MTETGRRPAPASTDSLKPERVIVASVVLYALSLVLPAMSEARLDSQLPPDRGYLVLAIGYIGAMIGQLGWFANPLWAAGLVFLHRERWRAASIAGVLAVLVAADTFMLYHTGIPSDSGRTHPFEGLRVGFWVWWASTWVLAAGALFLWRGERRARASAGR